MAGSDGGDDLTNDFGFEYTHEAIDDDAREAVWEHIHTIVKSTTRSGTLHIPRSAYGEPMPLCSKHETRRSWSIKPKNAFKGYEENLCGECVRHFRDEHTTGDLTPRQYEALQIALDEDYYEKKGIAGIDDVAARLDVTPSAAKRLLNRAHRRMANAEARRRGDGP